MHKRIFTSLLCLSLAFASCAQMQNTSSTPSNSSSQSTQTNQQPASQSSGSMFGFGNSQGDHIVDGLKEALSVSAVNSTNLLSITDGFFKNMAIKILMPPDAKIVEDKLRALGFGSQVDQMILSMNRAAEAAAKDATPIFIDAIKGMSFKDAMSIVTGANDAATQYLKKTTSTQLTTKFRPVIQNALDKVDATKYWSDIFTTYNKIPFAKPVNTDLTGYVTQKALDGLFYTMAQQEAKIRKDPAATANSLIQEVFGKH